MCRKLRAAALKSIHFGIAAGWLTGCTLLTPPTEPTEPVAVIAPARPDPAAPRLEALETRHFERSGRAEKLADLTPAAYWRRGVVGQSFDPTGWLGP